MSLKSVASSNSASAGKRCCLAFDFASFAIGLVAGALVGVLAGYLHETETIGELQERVRIAMVQFERISSASRRRTDEESAAADLRRQLSEL
ncbi:hypothetical protein, partial [[Eubacterium] cellulosolvens]